MSKELENKDVNIDAGNVIEDIEKSLADEIADIDFVDDVSLDESTEKDETDVVDGGESESVTEKDSKDSKDSTKEVDEESKDGQKIEKDTKTSKEKETETSPAVTEEEKETSQVAKLLVEIERLSGLIPKEVESVESDKKEGKDKKVDSENLSEVLHDFVGDLDMDDISADPKIFNKVLQAVAVRVQQQTTEQVLRSIPQVVMSQVNQQSYFKRIADKFYEDNPDLVSVKQVVRACAQQIQKEKPEWEVEKVFSETALRTRTTLGMSAQKISSSNSGDSSVPGIEDVAFGKSHGGSKSNVKRRKSSLQTEIDEL